MQDSAGTYWSYGDKYYMDFVGNLVLFPRWKNFENLLGIDKVIAMSLVYHFFGTVYKAVLFKMWIIIITSVEYIHISVHYLQTCNGNGLCLHLLLTENCRMFSNIPGKATAAVAVAVLILAVAVFILAVITSKLLL